MGFPGGRPGRGLLRSAANGRVPSGKGRGAINMPAEQPHGKAGNLFYLDLVVYLLSLVDRVGASNQGLGLWRTDAL